MNRGGCTGGVAVHCVPRLAPGGGRCPQGLIVWPPSGLMRKAERERENRIDENVGKGLQACGD